MQQAMRCFISGRVQGVFFRDSTRQQAQRLNITGFAKNLADGRVEVLAFGNKIALLQLKQWLHQGSLMASVTCVDCQIMSQPKIIPTNFTIG